MAGQWWQHNRQTPLTPTPPSLFNWTTPAQCSCCDQSHRTEITQSTSVAYSSSRGSAAPCLLRSTGVRPLATAKLAASRAAGPPPIASRPSNSAPPGGSGTKRPLPRSTSSRPLCHTTRPRLTVVVTLPRTLLPSEKEGMCVHVHKAVSDLSYVQRGTAAAARPHPCDQHVYTLTLIHVHVNA